MYDWGPHEVKYDPRQFIPFGCEMSVHLHFKLTTAFEVGMSIFVAFVFLGKPEVPIFEAGVVLGAGRCEKSNQRSSSHGEESTLATTPPR